MNPLGVFGWFPSDRSVRGAALLESHKAALHCGRKEATE